MATPSNIRNKYGSKNDLGRVMAYLSPEEKAIFTQYHLDDFKSLAMVQFSYEPIQAFLPFWNPFTATAKFPDFELSPTLEEISLITGLPLSLPFACIVRGNYVDSARHHFGEEGVNLFFDSFMIDRELTYRIIFSSGTSELSILRRVKAICLAIFGDIIFPSFNPRGYDGILIRFIDELFGTPGRCIVPYILGDLIHRLNLQAASGRFYGSNALLFMWIAEHLHLAVPRPYGGPDLISHRYRNPDWARIVGSAQALVALWSDPRMDHSTIRWYIGTEHNPGMYLCFRYRHHLLLPFFDGHVPYRPNRLMRQFNMFQDIPSYDHVGTGPQFVAMGDTEQRMSILALWATAIHLDYNPHTLPTYSLFTPEYGVWMMNGGLVEHVIIPEEVEAPVEVGEASASQVCPEVAFWREKFLLEEANHRETKRELSEELALMRASRDAYRCVHSRVLGKIPTYGAARLTLDLVGELANLRYSCLHLQRLLNPPQIPKAPYGTFPVFDNSGVFGDTPPGYKEFSDRAFGSS